MPLSYKDVDMSFESNIQRDIDIIHNDACIKQSIYNIILPKKSSYNRFQSSGIGTNITSLLGEKISNFTALQIEDEVENAIRNFEQRVILKTVESSLVESGLGYILNIMYQIKSTRSMDRLEVELEVII